MPPVQGFAPSRSEPTTPGLRALTEASWQLGGHQCRLSCQAVAPRMVLSLEPCTEASCWCHVGGAHCDLIPWVGAASRKVVVRAGVKSQGPLCRAAELKRAGGLSWPPGPPVQRAPMVVCLLGASGMAVQWRAHQIVEASVAGQPRVRLPVLDDAMHSRGSWTGCDLCNDGCLVMRLVLICQGRAPRVRS